MKKMNKENMKRKTGLILLTILFGVIMMLQTVKLTAFSSIPPAPSTGSPSDGASCINCHSGNPILNLNGVIETDIPQGGYVPGETYNVTIASGAERQNAQRYGFQLSPQDNNGNTIGTLVETTGTFVSADGQHIMHNGAQETSTPSWTFQWIAPEEGAGDFKFYLSVVAANFNNNPSGDEVILSSMEVQENQATTANKVFVRVPKVFANDQILSIEHPNLEQIKIYDVNGKLAYSSSSPSAVTDISTFESGMYIVTIKAEGKWFREKIIK